MFVNCFAEKPLVYNNYGRTLILKPGVNCVDEALFPIEDLIRTYGYAVINVIGEEKLEVKDEPKEDAPAEVVDTPTIVDEPKEDAPAVIEENKEAVAPKKAPVKKPAVKKSK